MSAFSPAADPARTALYRALGQASAYAPWRRFDPGPGVEPALRLAQLPVLTKQQIRRDFPMGFVPAEVDLAAGLSSGQVEYVKTSGTSGDAVTLLWSQPWWDASERASWQLNAHARRLMTGTHREAVLASPRCVGPPPRDRPASTEERTLGRLLFLNECPDVARWTDQDIHRMAEELRLYQPAVLEADPAYLAAFSRRARASRLVLYQPELLVFTYSYPSRAHVRQVRRSFRAPMMSSHGSTECGYTFVECEHGHLHQNAASCHVDFLPLTTAHGGPLLGRLVVTPFAHPWYCLLRFDLGDLALLRELPCECGNRDGLTLEAIAGRVNDALFTPAGRLVSVRELDETLCATTDFCNYRLDQPEPSRYALRFISDQPARDARLAQHALSTHLFGPGAKVTCQAVDALPPEPSGKYRLSSAGFATNLEACFAIHPPVSD